MPIPILRLQIFKEKFASLAHGLAGGTKCGNRVVTAYAGNAVFLEGTREAWGCAHIVWLIRPSALREK